MARAISRAYEDCQEAIPINVLSGGYDSVHFILSAKGSKWVCALYKITQP